MNHKGGIQNKRNYPSPEIFSSFALQGALFLWAILWGESEPQKEGGGGGEGD